MRHTKSIIWTLGLTALIVLAGAAHGQTPEKGFFVERPDADQSRLNHTVLRCKGRVALVLDAADENIHATPAIFGTAPGGGVGGQFDPVPLLTIPGVSLEEDECLNAHLSMIVGSAQTYGVAPMTLFQVTLTDAAGVITTMVGHFNFPFGIASPAVALEAETDVDMFAANFFTKVGFEEREVPPGVYTVDVWWAGAPPFTPGGALGAAAVLKLYLRD